MVLVLKEVKKILGDGQASGIDAVVESQLVGKPRDKGLKGTKSWSTKRNRDSLASVSDFTALI